MNPSLLPLVVEPAQLVSLLGNENLLVVDLRKPESYAASHIPGAIHLDYAHIVASRAPVMGLLPDDAQLSTVFSRLGLTPQTQVVAYDDEGGGRAARLLWTLELIAHPYYSLLNGGIHAWVAEHHPVNNRLEQRQPTDCRVAGKMPVAADLAHIRARLHDPHVVLVDARSPQEYSGQKRLAERGGHIPGAVNFDWVQAIDQQNHLRLIPADRLRAQLTQQGITPDKEAIVYCQTHHRSAHTYLVLKNLGYTRIRGYPGSWSEWGNHLDTPIE